MKIFSTDRLNKRRIARRRMMFFSSIFVLTSFATWFMADLLWRGGIDSLKIALLSLFVILFAHIATGFCTAIIGFFILNRGGDSCRIVNTVDWAEATERSPSPAPRTRWPAPPSSSPFTMKM